MKPSERDHMCVCVGGGTGSKVRGLCRGPCGKVSTRQMVREGEASRKVKSRLRAFQQTPHDPMWFEEVSGWWRVRACSR